MDEKALTAEAFLIAEYMRMRDLNAELCREAEEAKIRLEEAIVSKNGEGVLCLTNCITDCVKVTVETSQYSMFECDDAKKKLGKLTADKLREMCAWNYSELYEWGTRTGLGGWHGTAISEDTRKFAGYVEYSEYDHTSRRYIDPRHMETLYTVSDEADTGWWVPISLHDEVKQMAAEELREAFLTRIGKLEKEDVVVKADE